MAYKAGSGYAGGGVSYFAKKKPTSRRSPGYGMFYDPGLGPLPSGVARLGLDRILGASRTPPLSSYSGQARDFVNAAVSPVIAELQSEFKRRGEAGANQIRDFTAGEMPALQKIAGDVGAGYDTAIAGTKSSNTELAQFLSGEGDKASGDLAATLKAAGIQSDAAQHVANTGASAAGSTAALGNAALDQLQAERAGSVGYASTLPAAALASQGRNLHDFEGQMADALATQTGQVTSSIPQMVQDVMQQLYGAGADSAKNRAALTSDYLQSTRDRNSQAAIARGGFQSTMDVTNAKAGAQSELLSSQIDPGASRAAGVLVYKDGSIARDQGGNTVPYDPAVIQRQAAADRNTRAADAAATKRKAAHTTAVNNRTGYVKTVGGDVGRIVDQASHPKPVTKLVHGPYDKPGAKTLKQTYTPSREGFSHLFNRLMALPEVQLLQSKYGYSRDEVAKIVQDAMYGHGYSNPGDQGYGPAGGRGNRPG